MWSYYPELLARPVPRYTSYPTAVEFGEDVGAGELMAALEGETRDVSLYVHIPFCEKICWYCGCNTSAANRRERLATYLDALHREIALVSERLPRAVKVTRVAFGGGSPNAIAPLDFVRLMDALTVKFRLTAPTLSIELDPRTMTREWAAVLRAIGITRASLGVQTFDPALQEAIGRVQDARLIEDCTDMLRTAGVTSLNFDLMYGLPGQGEAELADSIARAAALRADRVALFGYAHVPHMIARQRRIDSAALPDGRARFEMAWQGWRQLTDEGYLPVGFDHFALPGDPMAQAMAGGRLRRNFQGFTDDQAPVLIGLGASAISSTPELIVQNEKNTGRYGMMLSQDRLAGTRGVRRSEEDRLRGGVIEALLCHGRAQVPQGLGAGVGRCLEPFTDHGLASYADGVLQIEPRGLPYARAVAALFDAYLPTSASKFSSAV